jgi:hypothetical protein
MEIKCRHCGAIADKAGQCAYCLKDLGSIPKAIIAASLTSIILFFIWAGIAAIFNAEYDWVSMFFGLLISGAVLFFSHGLGPKYQLIATTFTIVTIFFSDLFVTWFLWEGIELEVNSLFADQMKALISHQLTWDPFSWLFTFLGVSSGFYIWRYN